jgi:chorismate-pyruvate lyase
MYESLAWLAVPGADRILPGLVSDMVKDIRRTLVSDLTNDGKLIAVTRAVDSLFPPPGCVPAPVAAALIVKASTATQLMEHLAGEPLRIDLISRSYQAIGSTEAAELRAEEGSRVQYREGALIGTVSGKVVAEVTSLVLVERLPEAVVTALETSDVPLGRLLSGLGVRRESISVEPLADDTVFAVARMLLTGQPVALATEKIRVWS